MSKKLCKLVKEDYLEDHLDDYIELVKKPKFICKKCGRVTADEDRVCKPKKLKD